MNNTAKSIRSKLDVIVSIMIAICALWISIWQGCETRNHDMLSVRPALQITVHSTGGEVIGGEFNRAIFTKVSVKNNGVGPAFIKSLKFFHQESEYDFLDAQLLDELLSPSSIFLTGDDLAIDKVVPPGKEWYIVDYVVIEDLKEYAILRNDLLSLEQLIANSKLEIYYCSAYNECFTAR